MNEQIDLNKLTKVSIKIKKYNQNENEPFEVISKNIDLKEGENSANYNCG